MADILSCGARVEPYAKSRPPPPKHRRNADAIGPSVAPANLQSNPLVVPNGGCDGGAAEEDSIVLQFKRVGREYDIEWTHATPQVI